MTLKELAEELAATQAQLEALAAPPVYDVIDNSVLKVLDASNVKTFGRGNLELDKLIGVDAVKSALDILGHSAADDVAANLAGWTGLKQSAAEILAQKNLELDEALGMSAFDAATSGSFDSAISDSLATIGDVTSEKVTATALGSDPYRAALEVQNALIASATEALRGIHPPDPPSENLELLEGASELSEPLSVSGTTQGDDLSGIITGLTPGMKVMLVFALIQTLLVVVQTVITLRPDPQLVEMTEFLRVQNELLMRLLEIAEALPTGGS